MRYHVINMAAKMDVELGVPVDGALPGNGRVKAETLPAGRYASLIYQDVKRGVEANGALLRWGAEQGLQWDRWQTPEGDAFGGRIERYLTDPEHEPDPAKWETEVAIRLVDR
jgi:effector-binding domain-containing protein